MICQDEIQVIVEWHVTTVNTAGTTRVSPPQTSCPSCSQPLTIDANQIGIYAPNGVLVDPGELGAEERMKLIRIFRSEHPTIQTAVKTILEK